MLQNYRIAVDFVADKKLIFGIVDKKNHVQMFSVFLAFQQVSAIIFSQKTSQSQLW